MRKPCKKIAKLPWSVNVLLETEKISAWGAINQQYLRDNPNSLLLKYGPTFSNQKWYMLAIVDIFGEPTPNSTNSRLPPLMKSLMAASDATRMIIGRPNDFVGVTPVIIFRKLVNM